MTVAFTRVYPLACICLRMGIGAIPDGEGLPLNLAGGRGTRIPDLRLLLAVHAARQAVGSTVRIVRDRDLMTAAGNEPERLSFLFTQGAKGPAALARAGGPFNAAVAALMTMGTEGDDEGEVYPGS